MSTKYALLPAGFSDGKRYRYLDFATAAGVDLQKKYNARRAACAAAERLRAVRNAHGVAMYVDVVVAA